MDGGDEHQRSEVTLGRDRYNTISVTSCHKITAKFILKNINLNNF